MEDQIKPALDRVVQYDIENDIIRRETLGTEMSFADAEDAVRKVVRLAARIQGLDLSDVPEQHLVSLNTALGEFIASCDKASKFEVAQNQNPRASRDQVLNDLTGKAQKLHRVEFDVVAGVAALNAASTVSDALEAAEQRLETIKDTEAAAERALEAIRSATARGGVSVEAVTFEERAEAHRNAALRWLVSMGVFGAVAVVFVVAGAAMLDTGGSTSELVASAGVRFVLLSLLLYGLGYSGRNYAASRHSQVLNEHRADALNTFEAFVEGSSSLEVRDAVLLEATRAVFGPQPSGYLKGGAAEGQSPSTIFEVVRRVTDSES
ncbi:MAG: hypothetical protein AAGA65_09455 [Actinomycetota bacterium]